MTSNIAYACNDKIQLDTINEILKRENPDYVPNNDPTGATADILVGNQVQITYSLKRGVEIDCNTLDDETANDLG